MLAQKGDASGPWVLDGWSGGVFCPASAAEAAISSRALVHWAARGLRGGSPVRVRSQERRAGTGFGCPLWQAGASISRGIGVRSGVERRVGCGPSTVQCRDGCAA